MIVTFDSSILVRATKRSQGPARRVIDALAARPDHVIALSPFILGEVGKVLSYPRMQQLFGLTAEEIHGHVDFLRAISRVVEPQIGLPVVLLDPNDDANEIIQGRRSPSEAASRAEHLLDALGHFIVLQQSSCLGPSRRSVARCFLRSLVLEWTSLSYSALCGILGYSVALVALDHIRAQKHSALVRQIACLGGSSKPGI